MGCYSCGGNPNTFCRDCTYPKDTWIAPVDSLPDPFMGDFDHLFRTPDGNMYALAPDRSSWILMGGAGGAVQKPQNLELDRSTRELTITRGNTVTLPNDTQNLSINGRTITISNGNAINLPEDRDTVYNDAELRRRIQAVEDKADNFVSGVTVSREGNKVKLTYTFVNGAPKEVEFEDKDTITLAYDDAPLKARLTALENKQDRDNQTLTINNRTVSISGGNSITLPEDRDTIYDDADVKRRLTALEGKTDNFVTGVTASRTGNKIKLTYNFVTGQPKTVEFDDKDTIGIAYDDTALRNRVQALEGRTDTNTVYRDTKGTVRNNVTSKTNLMESSDVKAGDIVRDIDNSGTAPKEVFYKVTSVSGNTVNLTKLGERNLPVGTPYNDSALAGRVQALENKRDNDNQTLSISNNRLTISNGNSVDIPQPNLNNYVTVNQYNELKDAFTKLLEDLKGSEAWEQTGDTIFKGNLKPNRHLATGNINLFGGQPDGQYFIRTNNGSTENDLTGGI